MSTVKIINNNTFCNPYPDLFKITSKVLWNDNEVRAVRVEVIRIRDDQPIDQIITLRDKPSEYMITNYGTFEDGI